MKSNIIVIGASAGGIQALEGILRNLPKTLKATVFIVQHVAQGPSRLAEVLQRSCALPLKFPADRESIRQGQVFLAPPDLHMLLEKRAVRLGRGPRENHHRPAVDVLFRSAALHHGPRSIGVILTGAMDDGASGLLSIHHAGGTTIVQDPSTAEFRYMPQSAIRNGKADYILPLPDIAPLLAHLTQSTMKPRHGKLDSRPRRCRLEAH